VDIYVYDKLYLITFLFFVTIIFQAESSASKLGATSKTVGSAMAQLLTAASQVSHYHSNPAYLKSRTEINMEILKHRPTGYQNLLHLLP
jgi:hypothetical protein